MATTSLRPGPKLQARGAGSPHRIVSGNGVYPSADARAALMAIYDAKLAEWPVPFEDIDVHTRYGRTHIIAAGDPDAPPVVLLHMAASPSFLWRPIIAPLARLYRTYAIDTIGDVGDSQLDDPAVYPRRGEDYSEWLGDVFDGLDILAAHVIGASMGGWIALNHAACAPTQVRRLVLLAPMGLPSWLQTMKVFWRMASFTLWPSPARKQRYLTWLMGERESTREEAGEWTSTLLDARCTPRLGYPLSVPGKTLERVRAPTLVVLGGRDGLVGSAPKAARRARRHIRTTEIEYLPEAAHGVFIEEPGRVAARIVDFLD